jgi:hypothetical protein
MQELAVSATNTVLPQFTSILHQEVVKSYARYVYWLEH